MAQRENEVYHINQSFEHKHKSKYQAGFVFGIFDTIQSFIVDRKKFYLKHCNGLTNNYITRIIDEAKTCFGEEIELELRDLFSYELLLENLIFEVYGLYNLVEKGSLINLNSVSYQTTIESMTPSFKHQAD
jgi:hypothetical protein